jgi:hypothetical protein
VPLKFANNQSLTGTTALPSAVPTDNLILISTQTASNSATISFTSGLDSTYDAYEFKFININPVSESDNELLFNGSTDSGSNYNVTKTTTVFRAYHDEADTDTGLAYVANDDLAQSTSFQQITAWIGAGSDENACGTLQLFNPASTTYVKHFIVNSNSTRQDDVCTTHYTAGYFNTTSAINAVQFKMQTGNINSGIIKMYGVKKS